MKISLEWLSEFITWIEKDPNAIADRLTLSSAEVEEVEVQGRYLHHCCVGKIVKLQSHPNADRLRIVDVETDQGIRTVVCGGTNLREQMHVAFAHPGAQVRWQGGEEMTLARVKIRGVESNGMICAAEELDLTDRFPSSPQEGERPVIDLTACGLRVGSPLRDALELTDTILHISNTAITTRPDLFSHLGFARECCALGLARWKQEPSLRLPRLTHNTPSRNIRVECAQLVPRYLSAELTVTSLGETPAWMQRRLLATGWRLVNLPVDITNYVSMEMGVPLHSFDMDDLTGDVRLRLTGRNERITTLDGVERDLPEGVMILSDANGVFDLLGIMGGLRSSTKASTRRILLHAASLDPSAIRRAILATGHRTDAATVYEKGVPAITTEQGFLRALSLFRQLLPGAELCALDSQGTNGKAKPIPLPIDLVRGTLGIALPATQITKILTDLGCTVKHGTAQEKATLRVTPPLHRLRDLSGTHDLIEEIGRIHGYDRIPETPPIAALRIPERDARLHVMRDALCADGFLEIVPLSLMSPTAISASGLEMQHTLELLNPLGEETSVLQPSTLPALLEHAEKNIAHVSFLRSFHWGHVFASNAPEHLEITLLCAAKEELPLLETPFLQVKRSLLLCMQKMGYTLDVDIDSEPPPFAHPGRSARLRYEGSIVGTICELHPAITERFHLPYRAAAATLDLSSLLHAAPAPHPFTALPNFPSIIYDETVERSHASSIQPLLQSLATAHPLLSSVAIHDLYDGPPLGPLSYNVTLRFTYRAADRTLTEAEVKTAHDEVMRLVRA